jgi:hypothetical protein
MQPQLGPKYFTERTGVILFAGLVNQFGYIWRETGNADVGIDGQVEHVNTDGACTGHVVAVQVKTGSSFIDNGDTHDIAFYPNEKHIHYWRTFPVPVILAIVDPDSEIVYWTDVRRWLRSPMTANSKGIKIARDRKLTDASKSSLFESSGPVGGRLLDIDEILQEMVASRSSDPGFQMSYFDLFALGLIDIGTKLFFSMSLCMEIAEYRAERNEVGVGVGGVEHEFIDGYIEFLVAQNLINYDYSDYLIDRDERQLHPTFICQLTNRGRATVETMHKHERQRVVYESFVGMAYPFQERLPERLAGLEEMQQRTAATERSPQ